MSKTKQKVAKDLGKQKMPKRFEISTDLLNHALGFLALMPVYQSMELITRIKMDVTPVKEEEEDLPSQENEPQKEVKTVDINKESKA